MFFKTLVLSGLATVGSAHILMSNPVPYGKSSLSNGPMAPDGSDFPCKQRDGVYDLQGASNVYAQGSTQQLAFLGSAVHGGGSCQVSVTTDLKPNKNSVWKVIKSIEGGCPAKGAAGNLEGGAGLVGAKYDFTIPKELAGGNYTLAWTWFNKIGNREMYMNCAPLTVTGSGGSSSFMSSLPDMFTANIFGEQGCKTKEGTDVKFPSPGKDVDQFGLATSAALELPGPLCAQPTGGNGGGPSPTAGQPAPTAPASQVTQAPAPSSNPTKASKPGGVFITVSSKQPAATSVAPTNVPAPSSTQVAQPVVPTTAVPTAAVPTTPASKPAPSSGNGGGNTSSGIIAAGTPCTSEGSWNCIDGAYFQRCGSGSWSPVQGMPLGVSCTSGQSATLEMAQTKNSKRAMRRALRVAA